MTGIAYSSVFQSAQAAAAYDLVVYADGTQDAALWRLERDRLLAILDHLPTPASEMSHLDFACGTGRVLSVLERLTARSTGVDISPSMLELARSKLEHSDLRCGDLLSEPALTEPAYDLITAFRFFLNAEPGMRSAVMAALAARLRDDRSRLIFSIQGNRHSVRRFAIARDARRGIHHSEMSLADVRALTTAAGLEIEGWFGFGILPTLAYRLPVRRLAMLADRLAARIPVLHRWSVTLLFVCRPAGTGSVRASGTHAAHGAGAEAWPAICPPDLPVRALPSWEQPRLYIAASTPAARWRASDHYPATRPHARMARALFRASAGLGIGQVRHGAASRSRLESLVEGIVDDVDYVSVRISGASEGYTAPKLTAELRGSCGRRVYVKLAEAEHDVLRLRHERLVLERLPVGAGPRLLRYALTAAGEALVTEAIAGRRLAARSRSLDRLRPWLSRLETAGRAPVSEHPAWKGAGRATTVTARLLAMLEGREWPVVISHGDCAPWNFIVDSGGEARAVDWEFASLEGFPHLDETFFLLQTGALVDRRSPASAIRIAERSLLAHPDELEGRHARAIIGLVAVSMLRRAAAMGIPTGTTRWVWWKRVLRDVAR